MLIKIKIAERCSAQLVLFLVVIVGGLLAGCAAAPLKELPRAQEAVDGVKHTFDLQYQVKQRPWLFFGGAMLVGYVLGPRGGGSSAATDTPSEPFAQAQPQQSIVSEVRNQFKNDLATIKGAAFGAVISTLWAMAKQVLLPPARQIDGAITKPGAQPIDSPQQITNRVITSKTNGRTEV